MICFSNISRAHAYHYQVVTLWKRSPRMRTTISIAGMWTTQPEAVIANLRFQCNYQLREIWIYSEIDLIKRGVTFGGPTVYHGNECIITSTWTKRESVDNYNSWCSCWPSLFSSSSYDNLCDLGRYWLVRLVLVNDGWMMLQSWRLNDSFLIITWLRKW